MTHAPQTQVTVGTPSLRCTLCPDGRTRARMDMNKLISFTTFVGLRLRFFVVVVVVGFGVVVF